MRTPFFGSSAYKQKWNAFIQFAQAEPCILVYPAPAVTGANRWDNCQQFIVLLIIGKVLLIISWFPRFFRGREYPYLEELYFLVMILVLLWMLDTGAGAHYLHITLPDHLFIYPCCLCVPNRRWWEWKWSPCYHADERQSPYHLQLCHHLIPSMHQNEYAPGHNNQQSWMCNKNLTIRDWHGLLLRSFVKKMVFIIYVPFLKPVRTPQKFLFTAFCETIIEQFSFGEIFIKQQER